jgi:hypothetical protein
MNGKWTAQAVKDHNVSSTSGDPNTWRVWKPARPYTPWSLLRRLRLAWGVFIGRYDALDWEGH